MAAAQEGAAAVGMEGAAERSKGNSFDVGEFISSMWRGFDSFGNSITKYDISGDLLTQRINHAESESDEDLAEEDPKKKPPEKREAERKNSSKHQSKEKRKSRTKKSAAVKEFEEKLSLIRNHKSTTFQIWERQARS
mmetsp:Transcript_39878/g.125274  ORF Transcript_39878/g.125274 Transcript_39878/m.125274 type:complete len:137 (-) Transcript_39878:471-881(-)